METYTLYALVSTSNVDDIRYIGITGRSLRDRLYEHKSCKDNNYKDRWIKSELKKGFSIKLIPLVTNISKQDIFDLEIKTIANYKDKGFKLTNLSIGGTGGAIGSKWSDERRLKMSLGAKERAIKIGNSHRGKTNIILNPSKYNINKRKPVIQLDKEGNFINEYESIESCRKILNIPYSSIMQCCKGITNTSNSYIFLYKTNYNKEYINAILLKLKTRWSTRSLINKYKKVNMYDLNGNFIRSFDSIKEAKSNGYNYVSEICNNKMKSTKGYVFKFA